MDFATYQPLARRTLKELPTLYQHVVHLSLGVVGEFGELLDAAKKVVIYGKPVDQPNRVEEVGDIAWYLINFCKELKVAPEELEEPFVAGYSEGLGLKSLDSFDEAEALVALTAQSAMACNLICTHAGCSSSATAIVVEYAQKEVKSAVLCVAHDLGGACALLNVDISDALDKNIAKLAARYGDKYSDYSALNRELGTERAVLEGGASVGLAGVTATISTGTLAP